MVIAVTCVAGWYVIGMVLVWATLTGIDPTFRRADLAPVLLGGIYGPLMIFYYFMFACDDSKPIRWLSRRR